MLELELIIPLLILTYPGVPDVTGNELCDGYRTAKQDFKDSALPSDVVSLEATKSELAIGQRVQLNGRVYFDSVDRVDYETALYNCWIRRMELISFDDDEHDYWNTRNAYALAMEAEMIYYWVSGVPFEREGSKFSSLFWCPSNKTTNLKYAIKRPGNGKKMCLAYEKWTESFKFVDCRKKLSFVCEYGCQKAVCPLESSCIKKDSLIEVEGGSLKLKNANDYGIWSKIDDKTVFLRGKKLVTWTENWRTCCSLGLKPIPMKDFIIKPLKDSNTLENIFWTGITRQGCAGQFSTCFHNSEKPVGIEIVATQSDGGCVAVVGGPSLIKYMHFKSRPCSTRYNLSCVGELQFQYPQENLLEKSNGGIDCECDPKCENIEFIADDKKFIKNMLMRNLVLSPGFYGKWVHGIGVVMLAPDKLATWKEANNYCNGLYTNLLTVVNREKQSRLVHLNYTFLNGEVWTAGRDTASCPGKFKWCTSSFKDFVKADLLWKESPKGRTNSCLFLDLGDSSKPRMEDPKLGLADCEERKKFICEARYRYRNKTEQFKECLEIFSMHSNTKAAKFGKIPLNMYSYKMKTVMQCVAEKEGLIYGYSNLRESTILRKMDGLDIYYSYKLAMEDGTNFGNEDPRGAAKHFEKRLLRISPFYRKLAINHAVGALRKYKELTFTLYEELPQRIRYCSTKVKEKNELFAFNFLTCMMNNSGEAMENFWTYFNFGLPRNDFNMTWLDGQCGPIRGIPRILDLPEIYNIRIPFKEDIDIVGFGLEPGDTISAYENMAYCYEKNGFSPIAENKKEFEILYTYFKGKKNTIMWGFAGNKSGQMEWCVGEEDGFSKDYRPLVPIPVQGDTSKPHFLVSLPEPLPNLHAVGLEDNIQISTVYCMFHGNIIRNEMRNFIKYRLASDETTVNEFINLEKYA